MNLIGQMKVKDSNLFLMPGNPHMLHIGTISYGLREFVVMLEYQNQRVYIEEVVLESVNFSDDVWANMKFIDDDSLAFDLAKFAEDTKLIDMKRIYEYLHELKDRVWTKNKII